MIYLDKYRKAKVARELEKRYGEELLCANWNPMVPISAIFSHQCPPNLSPHLPDDLASVDLDTFLDRVYAFASRV